MANINLAQPDCFEYSVNNGLDVYNAQISEIDQFSGSSLDVVVQDDIAFHVSGDGLIRAYDVGTPDVPILLDTEVVGSLFGAPDSYRAAKIGVDGSRVFVAWIGSAYPTEVKINVDWDGRDESGRRSASGTYLAVLEAGGKRERARMVLVR